MIEHVLTYTVPAAYALLPAAWRSTPATALLLAIGLQESRFLERKQLGGPARGFWQFETSGVRGVLTHAATKDVIGSVLQTLRYTAGTGAARVTGCHRAIEHHDTLAYCFARGLLRTLPDALPGVEDVERAWAQYLQTWRPGRPHRETWDVFYREAWVRVAGAQGET